MTSLMEQLLKGIGTLARTPTTPQSHCCEDWLVAKYSGRPDEKPVLLIIGQLKYIFILYFVRYLLAKVTRLLGIMSQPVCVAVGIHVNAFPVVPREDGAEI